MDVKDILAKVDHTLLSQTATEEQIQQICDDGIKYGVASVCIPPSYVAFAKNYVGDKLRICTVIGFPNGYNTTKTKVFETKDAIKNGADEVDMVINIGMLKSGNINGVLKDIKAVRRASKDKVLKVIVETCLLSDDEKKIMCRLITRAKADFIKTSTGFSIGGATFDDVKLMRKKTGKDIKIKAAGGIKTLDDAQKFIELGADRLGTSRVVKIIKESNL